MSVSRELDDAGVSAREGEVLAALGEHLTNAEIADRLYISVRTVESHVSSLLRKLGVGDRRSLARLASGGADTAAPPPSEPGGTSWGATASVVTSSVGPSVRPGARSAPASGPGAATSSRLLPSPLTPFVGRVAERTALADAIDANRLVTAVGPGGVGKTRLALAVASDLANRFAGGVWYVDLVPVTDPAMITSTVASTVGLGEQLGRSVEDTLVAWLASRHALLVLDN
ncbi:MAG TPA: LuxR C-terminal-related transcriptional regulator, partial [Acidimicrobiales bacterium]|nr:LuxR C-terminal-related transcriptional regulator [Acidimicrobiales bacterium]